MNEWRIEPYRSSAWLVTPHGQRVALMTRARARGIAAALNTTEGRAAFERGRRVDNVRLPETVVETTTEDPGGTA